VSSALLLLLAAHASAFSFGLGKSSARANNTAQERAAEKETAKCKAARTSAGSATFTAAPTNLSQVRYIQALGNLNPPGHTHPTGHIYLYYIDPGDRDPNKFDKIVPVYAAADGYVSWVLRYTEAGAEQIKIVFTHTATVSSYYDHLSRLEPGLEAKLARFNERDACTWVEVKAGELLGWAGGVRGEMALDIGVTNAAVLQPFATPSHYGGGANADSPIKYFAEPHKSALYSLVDRRGPNHLGQTEKDGFVCFDVAGSASGNWIAEGAPDNWMNPEAWEQQLAIVYDPIYASQIRISFGGTFGSAPFGPRGVWAVQRGARAPAQVTAAGGPYGYQLNYWDPNFGSDLGVAQPPFGLLMVQVLDAHRMKVEYFPGSAAASLPFTSNAKLYVR
jgi:hypothetical protein